MNVNVKRIDPELPLPSYESNGAAGFDFLARIDVTVAAKAIELVPGNIIMQIPNGYMLAVFGRSSLPTKKGLTLPHGVGVIDSDYSGPDDEIWIQVFNFTNDSITVHRGEKIAQGVLIPVERADWVEVEHIGGQSRGGRGSTGGYSSATGN